LTRAAAGERKARVKRRIRRPLGKPLMNSSSTRFIELTRNKLLTVAKRMGAGARHATLQATARHG